MTESARDGLRSLARARPEFIHIHRTLREPGIDYRYRDLSADALIMHGYSGLMTLDGVGFALRPGSLSLIPRGMDRVFTPSEAGWHRVVNFRAPSAPRPLSAHIDIGYPQRCREFDDCLAYSAVDRSRAEIRAWDLLWSLQDSIDWSPGEGSLPPLIGEAVKLIECHLSSRLSMEELAGRLGVTAEHLSRRFSQVMGLPSAAYQRRRRMVLARHLIEGTDLSLKEIAAACGMGDAQWFNKSVRRAYGRSPTELRRAARSPESP